MRLGALSSLLVSFVATAQAQSSAYATVTIAPIQPNGEQNGPGSLESTLPIVCGLGCNYPVNTYYYCFVADTYPFNGGPVNRTLCNTEICEQTFYDQLSACLNCIVANGDERPFGYYTNTSMTAQQTGGIIPPNPNGLVNLQQANGILSNVTQRCSSLSTTLTGASTVTASPTTTGPYYETYTSGETVSITQWTGLSQYTSGLDRLTSPQVSTLYSNVAVATGSASQSGSSRSSMPSSSSAAASAAASSGTTSAARRSIAVIGLSGFVGAMAGLLAIVA